ncbi:MAG TPA: hypothetical protein DCP28_35080 [Cytophagales bacterium]|nr:hypothetical protein [Cytophagales bacterium]
MNSILNLTVPNGFHETLLRDPSSLKLVEVTVTPFPELIVYQAQFNCSNEEWVHKLGILAYGSALPQTTLEEAQAEGLRCLCDFLVAYHEEGGTQAFHYKTGDWSPISLNLISPDSYFERNQAVLNPGMLQEKVVTLVGCGSFGSATALGLAQAGIGNIQVVDNSTVSVANLARAALYQTSCIGRHKVYALKDQLREMCPFTRVTPLAVNVLEASELLSERVAKSDLVIATTDNNASRLLLQELCIEHQKPFLSSRAFARAHAGDIFLYDPEKDTPCYACMLQQAFGDEEITSEAQAEDVLPAYTTREDLQLAAEPGLQNDISVFVTALVRWSLMVLCKGSNRPLTELEEDFAHPYAFYVNRRGGHFKNTVPLAEAGVRDFTAHRWYTMDLPKVSGCLSCNAEFKMTG